MSKSSPCPFAGRMGGRWGDDSMKSKRELLAVVSPRYVTAAGTEKGRILDEFVATTGYHRK